MRPVYESYITMIDKLVKADYKSLIFEFRGYKVMVDFDLSKLYGVDTKRLKEQVKRNINRFPCDFMFELTVEEKDQLVAKCDRLQILKHSSVCPFVFTEQGVAMLSSILNSDRAIEVNIEIMRAFVRLRKMLSSHVDLARKLVSLEKKYDAQFRVVFEAIRALMAEPEKPERKIGFEVKEKAAKYKFKRRGLK